MTIPTTLTPGSVQLPEPCWTIIMVDGTALIAGDITPGCWPSKAGAEDGIAWWADEDRPAAFMQATPRDYRCWELTLICGASFVYDGEVEQTHFEDRADLLSAMDDRGVVQVDGVGQYADPECCEVCKAAIGTPGEPAAVEVHLDQVPLIPAAGDTIPLGWWL